MRSRPLAYRLLLSLVSCLLLTLATPLWAGDCGGCCGPKHCCPKTVICVPKIPRMKFERVCAPKPLCNPCELENYGYFDTCWRCWSSPPNFSHCVVPPASMVVDGPVAAPMLPPSVSSFANPGASVLPSMPGSGPEILSQPNY
jgi:hypothetical protein